MDNLPKERNGRELNRDPLSGKSNVLTITPPGQKPHNSKFRTCGNPAGFAVNSALLTIFFVSRAPLRSASRAESSTSLCEAAGAGNKEQFAKTHEGVGRRRYAYGQSTQQRHC